MDMKMFGNYLLDLLLSAHDLDKEDSWLILGFVFLRIGIGVGVLYLVESFPLIVSVEDAVYTSTFLLFGGALLLFLRRDKLLN